MKKLIKYIKLLGMFKNIQTAYEEETGKARPAYLSRRFVGAVIILIGGILSLHFGIKIDETLLADITGNTEKLIAAAILIYGGIMEIVGIIKRERKTSPMP
jgi:hypothetical protein